VTWKCPYTKNIVDLCVEQQATGFESRQFFRRYLLWRRGGSLAVLSAGFFLDVAVRPSRASPAPTGFVVRTHHVNDINPVGAKLAREAFNV
jgi:hypothetical protein